MRILVVTGMNLTRNDTQLINPMAEIDQSHGYFVLSHPYTYLLNEGLIERKAFSVTLLRHHKGLFIL